MPEPEVTEVRKQLRDTVRDFFAREVAPVCREMERQADPAVSMPWDLIRAGSQLGLRTLALPEEWGGISADAATRALLLTEMSRVEPGLAKCFYSCWRGSQFLYHLATPAQREKFLRPFVEDDTYCFSTAFTEPGAGSDNLIPSDDPNRGLTTAASRDGDEWVLNGQKQWISLAGFSKCVLVFARTNREVPVHRGSSLFVVPADWPGVSFPRVSQKLGFRLYPVGEVLLDDVRLPADHLLGSVDGAWGSLMPLIQEAVDYPATSLGISKAMYAIAREYARDRVQGGRPIIEHPTIGSRLAEMRMNIRTMESHIHGALRAMEDPKPYDPERTWLCKVHCDRATVQVMLGALEVTGGNGVMIDFPLERFCRDVLTSLHSDGTESLNLLRAARGMAEESRAAR